MRLRNILIIVGSVLVLTAGIVFGAFAIFILPSKKAPPTPAQLQSWQYAVDKITTNLQGSNLIQIQLTLQAPNSNVTNELTMRAAQVDDAVIGVLHHLSASEIMQPSGRVMLKKDVMDQINQFMTTGKITAVYIDSLIVQ